MLLQLLDERSPTSWPVTQNNWIETHLTEDQLEILSSLSVMAINDEDFFIPLLRNITLGPCLYGASELSRPSP